MGVYDELDRLDELFFLVSGGRDSTAMVLLAYEEGIKGNLLFGNTRFNLASARQTINDLQELTNWPLFTARYEGEKKAISILEDSFLKIPECVEIRKRTGIFQRNMFDCCRILKHNPMEKLQEELHFEFDGNITFIMGLKKEQPLHRLFRMGELREANTRYRTMTKNGFKYYYPLRDMKDNDVTEILKRHCYHNIPSSGCSICPIFCVFEDWRKKDPDTWRRSVTKADLLGVDHPAKGQQFLTEYQCRSIDDE